MTSASTHNIENMADSHIGEQLERILGDPVFQSTPQLSALLNYLVGESLENRADQLNAKSIAQAVFKRGEDFDSQSDTIVRVEAGRLRRRLTKYYETSGSGDPVIIEVPKGGYSPSFKDAPDKPGGDVPLEPGAAEDAPAQSEAEESFANSLRGRLTREPMAAAIIVALLLCAVVWMIAEIRPNPEITTPTSFDKPLILIRPLHHNGKPLETRISDQSVTSVISNLTKIQALSVMAYHSSLELLDTSPTLSQLRDDHGVSQVLDGKLEIDGDEVTIYVELVDTGTLETIWAEKLVGNLGGPDDMMSGLSDQIATALSVTLGPEEKKRIYLQHTGNLYALELFNYATRQIYPPTPARIEAARNLFSRVMEIDPGFAGGSAGLSEVHSYRVLFEKSVSPEDDLAAAINYAQQAIDLDPDFGMGHAMLGVAYTLMGQYDLGLSYTHRAVGLEPGDPLSHQWLALSLIRAGRPGEAIAPIQEAQRLDPLQPQMPYLPILGMAFFLSGQYDSALETFLRDKLSGIKRGPYVSALHTLTLAELGREQEARALIDELNRDLRRSPFPVEHWLGGMIQDEALRQRSLETLSRLGLGASVAR